MINRKYFSVFSCILYIWLFYDGVSYSHTIMTKSFSEIKVENIWKKDGRVYFTECNGTCETYYFPESSILFIEYDKKKSEQTQIKNGNIGNHITKQHKNIDINPPKKIVRSELIKQNDSKLKSTIKSMLSSVDKYYFIQFIMSKRNTQITLEINGKLKNFSGSPSSEYVTVNSIAFDFKRNSLSIAEFKNYHSKEKKKIVNNYFSAANTKLKNRNYQAALSYYKEISDMYADSYQSYYGRGLCLLINGEYQKSIEQFNRSIKLNPSNTNSFLYRGIAFEKQQKREMAIDNYTKVIELDPQNFIGYGLRGAAVYDKQADFDKVSTDSEIFNQLLAKQKDPNNCFQGLHNANYIKGRLKYLNQM